MTFRRTRVARHHARRRRQRAGRAAATAALLLVILLAAGGAGATGCTPGTALWCTSPFAFTDPYTSPDYVNGAASTAAVDTSGTGTVYLPPNPMALALDPTRSVGVLATHAGVQGWAFQGGATERAPQYDLPGTGYVGAAWLDRGGSLLAAVTPSQLTLFAWTGAGWAQVSTLAVSQANSVAPGPEVTGASASVLVGTPAGFEVVVYQAGALAMMGGAGVDGLTGAGGVAAAQDGSMAAVWSGGTLDVYAWDGTGYVETPTWEVPAATTAVRSVAWFRDGGGYWILDATGTLDAYAFDGSFVVKESTLSATVALPAGPIASGWRQGDVAVLVPAGWSYYDGTPLGVDATRSVTGQSLPYYQMSAVLQSTGLTAADNVSQVQLDATVDKLPTGTQVAYQLSADGGQTWTPVPYCTLPAGAAPPDTQPPSACSADNTTVPAGSQIAYRLLLSTTNPAVTPVVDLTQVLEIAGITSAVSQSTLCAVIGAHPCVVLIR